MPLWSIHKKVITSRGSHVLCIPVLLSNFVSVLWKRSCISCSRDPSTLADSWARRLMATRCHQDIPGLRNAMETYWNTCGWCECMWMLNWRKLDTVEARSPDLFNVAFQLFICHPMTSHDSDLMGGSSLLRACKWPSTLPMVWDSAANPQ